MTNNRQTLLHLLIGQPGSGKDQRLPIIANMLGADILNLGDSFSKKLDMISEKLKENDIPLSSFEKNHQLMSDREIKDKIKSNEFNIDTVNSTLTLIKILYYSEKKISLIPDSIVNDFLESELINIICNQIGRDILINSYPKTISQYEYLLELTQKRYYNNGLTIGNIFIMEKISEDLLIKRMNGRMICSKCPTTYDIDEINNYVCACGGELKFRRDKELYKKRINDYKNKTEPLSNHIIKNHRDYVVHLKSDYEILRTDIIRNELRQKLKIA